MSEELIIESAFALTAEDKKALVKKLFSVKPDAVFFGSSAVVLKSDGTVVYLGKDKTLREKISNLSNITKVVSGVSHLAALRADGTVFAAGDDSNGQCKVSMWKNVSDIFASGNCTVGITVEDEVYLAGTTEAAVP